MLTRVRRVAEIQSARDRALLDAAALFASHTRFRVVTAKGMVAPRLAILTRVDASVSRSRQDPSAVFGLPTHALVLAVKVERVPCQRDCFTCATIWPAHVERWAVSASRAAKLTLPSAFWMLKSSRF